MCCHLLVLSDHKLKVLFYFWKILVSTNTSFYYSLWHRIWVLGFCRSDAELRVSRSSTSCAHGVTNVIKWTRGDDLKLGHVTYALHVLLTARRWRLVILEQHSPWLGIRSRMKTPVNHSSHASAEFAVMQHGILPLMQRRVHHTGCSVCYPSFNKSEKQATFSSHS